MMRRKNKRFSDNNNEINIKIILSYDANTTNKNQDGFILNVLSFEMWIVIKIKPRFQSGHN